MIVALIIVLSCLVMTGLVLAGVSVRVLREYERGVVFRLGRVTSQRGPGLIFLVPAIDRMVRVSLRTVTLQIPAQEVITRDNVPARVTAVAYYRIVDSTKSVIEIENVLAATSQIAQTTLRSVLGKAELDSLLAERERLDEALTAARAALDAATSGHERLEPGAGPVPGSSTSEPERSPQDTLE
jgi:regulator of protease activity HflC (stomatin/prohibitin superfamily)